MVEFAIESLKSATYIQIAWVSLSDLDLYREMEKGVESEKLMEVNQTY